MGDNADVVVVGGGIAGASLAGALARAGATVDVLEATERFVDRVRGESVMPWGVAEAERLGVRDTLLAAGAHVSPLWLRHGESDPKPSEIPVGILVPGVDGTLNLGHPAACQALLDDAEASGARVERGVTDVVVDVSEPSPTVTYRTSQGEQRRRPAVVVGADGRASVTRRSAGITLERAPETSVIAGVLLGDVAGPDDHDMVVETDLGMALVLRQTGGRARCYHIVPPELHRRYAGPDGSDVLLADLRGAAALTDVLAQARCIGPSGTFRGDDTWTERPFGDGVVLVGDAAGHNDPSIGCGLSIALRDARTVADLLVNGARSADDFVPYGEERVERMRRLRAVADLLVDHVVRPGPDRSERRRSLAEAMATFTPPTFPMVLAMFAGPESIPDEIAACA